jgi:hypothetical protein
MPIAERLQSAVMQLERAAGVLRMSDDEVLNEVR